MPRLRPQPPYVRAVWTGDPVAPVLVQSPEEARAYWFRHVAAHPFFDPDKESLAVLLLNARLRALGWHLVSVGSLNECFCHPREVLRPAIAAAAYALIVLHNHPSGRSRPSPADHTMTHRLSDACRVMGMVFHDHVIVGRTPRQRLFSYRAAHRL